MPYPAYPIGGSTPCWLNPFDQRIFNGVDSMDGETTFVPAIPPVGWGGAVVIAGPWTVVGPFVTGPNPRSAMFSWMGFANQKVGIQFPAYLPCIRGPGVFGWFGTNPGL